MKKLQFAAAFAAISSSVCISAFAAAPEPAKSARAEEVLDRFYAAIGGRDVWAAGHGEYVLAKISDPRFPLPGTFEFCWSWDAPNTVDRSRFQDLTQYRALYNNEGWTFVKPSGSANGKITDWNGARLQRGVSEWNGNFEVLAHRIAKRDPLVSTEMGEGEKSGWVKINVSGKTVSYLLIDDEGSPKKFHRLFDDARINFGPLVERGRTTFISWGAFEGGDPFDIIAFEILDKAPTEAFERPGVEDSGSLDCR